MSRSLCIVILLLLVETSAAAQGNQQKVLQARSDSIAFTAASIRDSVFTLPVAWVILDSLRITRNEKQIAEYTHWRLLDPGNRIWLYTPLGPKDTLRVLYSYRPIPLFRSYARRSLRSLTRETSRDDSIRILQAPARTQRSQEGWSRLNKSGSLIRSVQIGTGRDLELESALNLQIEGRIGKNIEVVAALTDQSTPIQPEGTTESIQELEKVFVSVRSPNLAATLGDYDLRMEGGRYDSYSRKLTGVLGEANFPAFKALASGAVSDGEFATNSITGIEAVQGPYQLTGRADEIGIVVLAGTETVWLDGQQMRRGEGNDYIIDYASGEITFTSRRIITSDSRIVIDFEYANEEYQRTYAAFGSEVGEEHSRFQVSASIISESDDRNRPLGLVLTEEDRSALKDAGDSPDAAVTFAADSIGLNGGDYVRVDMIFVYAPRDSNDAPTGEWNVIFDDFGTGGGDYEAWADSLSRGRTFYRWVGPSLGRYLPFRRVPLPESQSLMDVRLTSQPVQGLRLSGELASSVLDRNAYSGLDDADNDGLAGAAALDFSRSKPVLFGIQPHRIDLRSELRYRNKTFTDISRSSEIEFDRDWDADLRSAVNETIFESSADISPVSAVTFSGGVGLLDRESVQSSERYTAAIRVRLHENFSASATHLQLFSEDSTSGRRGNWIRQSGDISARSGRFSPRLKLLRERKRDKNGNQISGFRYLDYRAGVGIQLPHNLNLDGEYGQRLDEKLLSRDAFSDSATATTISAEGGWRPPEIGWTNFRYVHREKNYFRNDTADVETDVGRLETLIAARNRVAELNLTYEVAKTRTQNQLLIAIEVEPGTGDYRRGGEGEPSFIPDDQGDIILVSRNTGSFEPATEIELSSLFWFRLDELTNKNITPFFRALSSETELTIEERSRFPLNAGLLLLNQSKYRGDSTISGRLTLREDLHINRLSRKLSVRFRYRESQSVENQILNGGQSRIRREGSTRVRARYLKNLRGESEAGLSRETTDHPAGIIPARSIDRWDIRQETTLSLSRFWEFGLGLQASDVTDERTHVQASLREIKPRAAFSIPAKGRMDVDFTWTHASSNKATIPFELGAGSNRGDNFRWNLRGTYQFARNFSGSLSYNGRLDAGERTFHTGRVEVRAMF